LSGDFPNSERSGGIDAAAPSRGDAN